MRRVPLLSGSRVVLVPVGDEDELLRPPAPPTHVADTVPAVRDAFRFPLSGPPLDELARGARQATIVVEPPVLPFPGVQRDPRQEALAATIDELARFGVDDRRQTILVAGGLGRRLGRSELERLLPPPRARSFRGRVIVHDAESPALVPIAERPETREGGSEPILIAPELVETDLAVVVSAAETIVDGGPGTLVRACDPETVRATAAAESLLMAAGTPEWRLVLRVEGALAERSSLAGVSLVLDHPRVGGALRGYPEDDRVLERLARSDLRLAASLLPGVLRRGLLARQSRTLAAVAAFAGPPAVAHAEALVRGVARRGAPLARAVDTLVVPAPWFGLRPTAAGANPIAVSAATLGLALRLHRDAFPVERGGTVVLLHPLHRSFREAAQAPYGETFEALRHGPEELNAAERRAAHSERAIAAYRAGRAPHPLVPYADWAGCAPARAHLGRVVVAGCRDATAARTLGFVPTRSVSSGLEMAHGVAGGSARVGILLGPPYPPLLVGP